MNIQRPIAAASRSREDAKGAVSGPRIYNLFPLLVGTVAAWRAELPRIAGMHFDWVYLNPFHETGGSRSLYAVKNPHRLDDRFREPGGSRRRRRGAANGPGRKGGWRSPAA